MKRTCSVRALEYCTLAVIEKDDFVAMRENLPSIFLNFKEHINTYNDSDIRYRKLMLKNVPYFRTL